MRDFLDHLIDRHAEAASPLKPRLPALFEPEVSQDGLAVAARDDRAIVIGETDPPGPFMRIKEKFPPHSDTTTRAAIEPVHTIAVPSQTLAATQGSPSIDGGPNGPGFPLGPREGAEVRAARSARDPLTASDSLTLSQRERGPDAGVPKVSAATQAAPVTSRVRYAHQEERTNSTSTTTRVDEQASVEELSKPVFYVTPRESAGVRAAPSGSDPLTASDPLTLALSEGKRGFDHGLLRPSATSISPVYPSVARTASPAAGPEPVINVSIGRIEVRATLAPQKQAPRPEIRTPVMGLEEYLRRRSGGQDR
ncbi:MAG: hypothetical protein ACREXY_02975 [Gammaproteobacteria bacterium]